MGGVERTRLVLAELQDAEAAVNRQALNPSDVLRISTSLSFSLHQIAPRLKRHHQLYPNVRVHVEAANRYLGSFLNRL